MNVLRRIAKVCLGIIGVACMIGGVIFIATGAMNRFGNPAIADLEFAGLVLGGAACLSIGFGMLYTACDRDIWGVLEWIIDIFLIWP